MEEFPIHQVRDRLEELVEKSAAGCGRTNLVDVQGHWVATIIGAKELAELEDLAAIGRLHLDRAAGMDRSVPLAEALDRLGVEPGEPVRNVPKS
jgi:antitoxin (DNA-binding transcriptional repressor) of toxin-antitoxin stability system